MELWEVNLKKKVLSVSTFKFTRPSYQKSKHKSIFQHLNASIIHFLNNFDDLHFTKYSWIQNPLMGEDDEFGLISNEKENLIKLASDNSLNNIFRIYP